VLKKFVAAEIFLLIEMKKSFSVLLLALFFSTELFCQFDTTAFRKIPGDLYCCTDDSTELLNDSIIIPKYSAQKSAFLLNWEKHCDPIDPAPYIFFQPNSDSILFVYGFSQGKNIIPDDDDPDTGQKILVLRGTWQFGKNSSLIEANFPAWKMNVTWKVEDHTDYWLFIRKK